MLATSPLSDSFERPAGPDVIGRFRSAVFLIVAFVGVMLPFRSITIGTFSAFYAGYGIALCGGFVLSSILLTWWARRRHKSAAIVSATYVTVAIIVFANVVLFLDPVQTTQSRQTSEWLWAIRHVALPLGVLISTSPALVARACFRESMIVAWLAGAASIILAVLGAHYVPAYQSGHASAALYAVGSIGVAGGFFALYRLLYRRSLSTFDLVLALVVATAVGEVALGLFSPYRVSLGSYASRILALFSGLFVAATFARWLADAVERSHDFSHYVSLAESSPNITFLATVGGACFYASKRFTELTGDDAKEALGTGFHRYIHPEDLTKRIADPDWFRTDNQVRLRDRNGSYVWHLVRYRELRDRSGRQVGWLGTATNMDREHRALDESRRLTEELRQRFESEHELSSALRAAFLPRTLPEIDGLRFSAVYRPIPTDNIGGDWYDAFALPEDVLAFTMGDVSGHGMASAAGMLRIRETLRMAALTEKSPGRALELANRALSAGGDAVVTAIVAFVKTRTGEIKIASAGHPAPILVRKDTATMLPVRGIVLAVEEAATFNEFTTTLMPGDKIAFYTDGLIECQKNPIDGERLLLAALERTAGDELESLVERLLSGGQVDDATIVQLAFDPERVEVISGADRVVADRSALTLD